MSFGDKTYINNITGSVTINYGVINAIGGVYAAGIGGGSNGTLSSISITGGTVTATGRNDGAAIGLGYNHFGSGLGTLTCPTIEITAGSVTANGSIGYGEAYCSDSNIGGTITFTPSKKITLRTKFYCPQYMLKGITSAVKR